MADFIDFEMIDISAGPPLDFDVVIVGGGAAGLTLAREFSGSGLRIAVVESGALAEDQDHEALNEVEVSQNQLDGAYQASREVWHAPQLTFWRSDVQRYGVRCRVLGGSTAGWAGKVASFSQVDYSPRPWIADSGWPLSQEILEPYVQRAAEHLDLGPLVQDNAFWGLYPRHPPQMLAKQLSFTSFFWQVARSGNDLADVMRFGPDFQKEQHVGITILYNATVAAVLNRNERATGVEIRSSLSGRNTVALSAKRVVLAAGAIENPRILLLSRDENGQALGNARDVVGRYLTDHPSISVGTFAPANQNAASVVLGYFALRRDHRVFMYSHGLSLNPDVQADLCLPNLAFFAMPSFAHDNPLQALKRLIKLKSANLAGDVWSVLRNVGFVATTLGRAMLNYRRIPKALRRMIADIAIFVDANFVASDYMAKGFGRKLKCLDLVIVVEQPPHFENRITLSRKTDRLGLPMAHVTWGIDKDLQRKVALAAALVKDEMRLAGIDDHFRLHSEDECADRLGLGLRDMGHSAGTTRMGTDPATSVVNPDCQVHGVEGLYVAGASVFPTSGHANLTLMIMAQAIRLADHIKSEVGNVADGNGGGKAAVPLATPENSTERQGNGLLVLVTGGTGAIGRVLIEHLLQRGYCIRATYRNIKPDDPRVEWVLADFANPSVAFEPVLAGVKAVFHLAVSFTEAEMETTNVDNLEQLAAACTKEGVKYFSQASSMVVYGSPRTRMISEVSPVLDLGRPLHKQYFARRSLQLYAQSKLRGERILAKFAGTMRIDICRITVAKDKDVLVYPLGWSTARALFFLYRNSHYISQRNVARALVHLMERELERGATGLEVFNICDRNSPTYVEIYRRAGKKVGIHVPILFDLLNGFRISRGLVLRYPMGCFRVDDSKLKSTGFELEK